MINKFAVFENLQQATNWLKLHQDDPNYHINMDLYKKMVGDVQFYKSGLLYLFTLLLFDRQDDEGQKIDLITIKDCVKKIRDYNIKINAQKYIDDFFQDNGMPAGGHLERLCKYIADEIIKYKTNKFIDRWAPGFLKKELKDKQKKYFYDLKNVLFDLYYGVSFIDLIDTALLRGKMSMFKEPEQWIEHVSNTKIEKGEDNVEKIKNSNDVKIYYENDEWIMYQPTTFESMNMIVYPYWCTVVKPTYFENVYCGFWWIILYNKIDKKESYIVEFKRDPYYGEVLNSERFSIHNYTDLQVWSSNLVSNYEECVNRVLKQDSTWLGGKKITESEISVFKVFFDTVKIKYIKNKYGDKIKNIIEPKNLNKIKKIIL